MAGCVPCFIIPLLLFIFHRYIQPIILKFWNPWEDKQIKEGESNNKCEFRCDCSWNKKPQQELKKSIDDNETTNEGTKIKDA